MDVRLSLVPLDTDHLADQVNHIVDATQSLWFWSRPQWRDYELARNPKLEDHSWALVDKEYRVHAAQLLTYNPDDLEYGLGDLPAPPPAILPPDGDDSHYDFDYEQCRAGLIARCEKSGSLRLKSAIWHPHFKSEFTDQEMVMAGQDRKALICAWGYAHTCASPLMGQWVDVGHKTRIINLQKEQDQLWHDMRKSYRHLIRDSKLNIGTETHSEARKICQDLHQRAAGGKTRPTDSWIYQDAWAQQNQASWFIARDPDTTQPVGFAYVIRDKRYAYYASAASLTPNVSHAIQWAVIKHLKGLGVTYYEMGHQGVGVTKKESNIEFFRRGFGGEDFVQPIYTCDVRPVNRVVH